MKIIDYKTTTDKDLFVLRLNGDTPLFDNIGDSEFAEFFRICIELGLVKFMVQREWRGSPAILKVLNPFVFRIEKFIDNMSTAIVNCEKDDTIELTELLDTTDYKFSQNGTDQTRHTIRVDIPSDGKRHKAYEKFNYDI